MKLIELAYLTDYVQQMSDFYRNLPGVEPVAKSDDMAIFMNGDVKVFIHTCCIRRCSPLPRSGFDGLKSYLLFTFRYAHTIITRIPTTGSTTCILSLATGVTDNRPINNINTNAAYLRKP